MMSMAEVLRVDIAMALSISLRYEASPYTGSGNWGKRHGNKTKGKKVGLLGKATSAHPSAA
jgi:hypothetical protein